MQAQQKGENETCSERHVDTDRMWDLGCTGRRTGDVGV